MGGTSMLTLIALLSLTGAEVLPLQVVPHGLESVNGSDTNMGCASALVDRGGVMVCDRSYLVDGYSPAINTSTSDWASQLVTVRKNEANDVIHFDHVLLIFDFDTAVSPTSIELDMFLCTEWNIGAMVVYVFAYQNSTLVYNPAMERTTGIHLLSQSQSCDSLSNVSIALGHFISSYHSWHILVSFASEDIEWVHVGEVRFLSSHITNPTIKKPSTHGSLSRTHGTQTTHGSLRSTPTSTDTTKPKCELVCFESLSSTLDHFPVKSSLIPAGKRENDCGYIIGVSALSFLLIVTLTIITVTQCLVMVRMRKSKNVVQRNEGYAEVKTSTTEQSDVPVTPNEAYGLHKIATTNIEAEYEIVR